MFRILNCIVAVCPDMGIGKNGNLPWHPIRLRWARSRSLLLLTLHVLLYWYNHIKSVFQDQRVMSFVFCNSYKLLLVCSDMFNIYKSMWQFFKMTIHKLIKWKRLTKSLRQNGRNNNISNMKSNILWFHRSWELELCPAKKKKKTPDMLLTFYTKQASKYSISQPLDQRFFFLIFLVMNSSTFKRWPWPLQLRVIQCFHICHSSYCLYILLVCSEISQIFNQISILLSFAFTLYVIWQVKRMWSSWAERLGSLFLHKTDP